MDKKKLSLITIFILIIIGVVYSNRGVQEECSAKTEEECGIKPDCYWKFQGGKIEASYTCCPRDKTKSPDRCTVRID